MLATTHSIRCARVGAIMLCVLGLTTSIRAQCTACISPPPTISTATLAAAALMANGGIEPNDVDFEYDDDPRSPNNSTFWEGGLVWDDTITVYPVTLRRTYQTSHPGVDFNSPLGNGLLSVHIRHELSHKCLSDSGAPDDNAFDSCQHIAIRTDAAKYACDKADEIGDAIYALRAESPLPVDEIAALEATRAGVCAGGDEQRDKTNTRNGAAAAKDCLCSSPAYAPPPSCPDLVIPPPPSGCSSDYPNNEIIPDCPYCP